jgi:hypothetical protein
LSGLKIQPLSWNRRVRENCTPATALSKNGHTPNVIPVALARGLEPV